MLAYIVKRSYLKIKRKLQEDKPKRRRGKAKSKKQAVKKVTKKRTSKPVKRATKRAVKATNKRAFKQKKGRGRIAKSIGVVVIVSVIGAPVYDLIKSPQARYNWGQTIESVRPAIGGYLFTGVRAVVDATPLSNTSLGREIVNTVELWTKTPAKGSGHVPPIVAPAQQEQSPTNPEKVDWINNPFL